MNYPGTVLLVSHDREFLNNVVTGLLVMERGGSVREYVGGYDDWLRQSTAEKKAKEEKLAVKEVKQPPAKESTRKLTFKEKKELDAIPAMIETLEARQRQLHEKMAAPDFYKRGAEVAVAANTLKELSRQLEEAYDRWHELEKVQSEK